MRRVVIVAIVVLMILHQDFWWWDDIHPLVLGFVPIGLAYQAVISVLAAVLWALATRYCWPAGVDDDSFATGE